MKKRTFKSVFGVRRTSSPHGTSTPMVATAKSNKLNEPRDAAQPSMLGDPISTLKQVSEDIRAMTPAEFRESLVKAGIIGVDGKLTEPYARAEKK